jgi:hypothetical protein
VLIRVLAGPHGSPSLSCIVVWRVSLVDAAAVASSHLGGQEVCGKVVRGNPKCRGDEPSSTSDQYQVPITSVRYP